MRAKKHSLIISLIVVSVSVLAFTILYVIGRSIDSSLIQLLINVFIGLFTSSLSTMFIFVYEYHNSRKNAILGFCELVTEVENIYQSIPYLPVTKNISKETDNASVDCVAVFDKYKCNSIIDKYIRIAEMKNTVTRAYDELDFFSDSLCYNKKRFGKLVSIKPKSNDKNIDKYEKEKAKARYCSDYPCGKHKKVVRDKIYVPFISVIDQISKYTNNKFRWYKEGLQSDKKGLLDALFLLQANAFPYCEENKGRAFPFHNEVYYFSKTVNGNHAFWMEPTKEVNAVDSEEIRK